MVAVSTVLSVFNLQKQQWAYLYMFSSQKCLLTLLFVCRCFRMPRSFCRAIRSTQRSRLRCLLTSSSSLTCRFLTSSWTKVGWKHAHIVSPIRSPLGFIQLCLTESKPERECVLVSLSAFWQLLTQICPQCPSSICVLCLSPSSSSSSFLPSYHLVIRG